MKRLIVILLFSILLFSLVACSESEQESSSLAGEAPRLPLPMDAEDVEAGDPAAAGAPAEHADDFVGELPAAEKAEDGSKLQKAVDFSLTDQNGVRHNLADYAGKVIVLNFWQSWCPPCRSEMPDFQKVYVDYGENKEDVVILGVSSPQNDLNETYFKEALDAAGLKDFMDDNGYTYPTLMDYKAELYTKYMISAFPTTFVIKPDGYLLGIVPGSISEADLVRFIEQAKESQDEPND